MKPSFWGETFFRSALKIFLLDLWSCSRYVEGVFNVLLCTGKRIMNIWYVLQNIFKKSWPPLLTPLRYNLGDLNLWCQRVCHLMIRRECLKKVLLCNMLRFPTIQFVHMQTFATTSCQIQNDALQFFINSVDWRLHSDNFKFSYICAHLHINKKWKINKMIHGRQL